MAGVFSAPRSFAWAVSTNWRARFVGMQHTFTAGQSASFDYELTSAVRLQGGYYWVKGAALNDAVSLYVVDVNDILGMGAGAIVSTYVSNMPVAPWDHQQELSSPTASEIPAGLFLRVVYDSFGATDPVLGITYRWYEPA